MTKQELKQWVLDHLYKDGKIQSARMKRWSSTSPYWTEKNFPDVHMKLCMLPGRTFSEQINLLMTEQEEIPRCKACGEVVDFKSFDKGHYGYCSIKCTNRDSDLNNIKVHNKRVTGGYDRAVSSAKVTFTEKYGVEWMTQADVVKTKKVATVQDRYGVDNVMYLDEYKQKQQATNLLKYGVSSPTQHPDIHAKALANGQGRSKVRWVGDGSIWYQGLYEKRFLEQCLANGDEIQRGTQLKYVSLDGKEHRYTPDFIVNGDIYEIKSDWTWDNKGKNKKLRVVNKLKLRAATRAGFKVWLVVENKTLTYSEVIQQKELRI